MFLQTNLEYLLHARRTNPSRLQQEEGILQPTVHKILKGRSTNPRPGGYVVALNARGFLLLKI